jgi:hypothetical protein
MKTVGILNEKGLKSFREFLNRLRAGEKPSAPLEILDDLEYSQPLRSIEVDTRAFTSRLEAAEYLTSKLGSLTNMDYNVGLWAWLTLFYFDQVCPSNEVGDRHVGAEARYIPGSESWRYYRHLLAGPFRIFQLHGQQSKLLLTGPLDRPGDFTEQLASRQEFITNRTIMETATQLYFDSQNERPKRGAASTKRKPGTLRRFVDLVQQLDLTYDLYSLEPDGLLKLLPKEFDGWHSDPVSTVP